MPRHSKTEIVGAGKVLAAPALALSDEAISAFRIAHDWRLAHIVPMQKLRYDLTLNTRRVQAGGITAARLKRIQSIRRKLRDTHYTLFQVQDIAGCRSIVSSMSELNALVERYRDDYGRHVIRRVDDYIGKPKTGGYRSYHAVYKFRGTYPHHELDRQLVEIQIRTRLQHAWATAVEAVGLMRSENLKAGEGDNDWLRLFTLMSAEFAFEERQPLPAAVSETPNERRDELLQLNEKLNASEYLERYNQAIQHTEGYASNINHRFYILQFDPATMNVSVRSFSSYPKTFDSYLGQELGDNSERNTVLVEVDKLSDLRSAYPNYFLDVRAFNYRLRRLLSLPTDDEPIDAKSLPASGWLGVYNRMRRRG